MKTIFRVAKTELYTLFFSPIAWFLLIVFLIQCGVVYLGQLDGAARQQELGGMAMMYMDTLTMRIFLSPRGLFGSVMQNLYLYIPLLTMSLISRETSSGTIKLLYSSPIKVREIVFGKYLAMVIYSLLLVAIVGIFVVSGMFHVQHPDSGMLMTAMLGFFLLLCAYSAIGLFMSCLTTYQVVAAICTFVMIGILSFIGTLWQDIAFVRNLTYFLSINGRTQKMLSGLVTTKDVIYFIVIVYMFLGFSIYKLKGGMESKPAMVKAGRYAVIVISALMIGYVSALPGLIGYYDATANKERTLTPKVQGIIKELGDEPLEITAYNNLLGRYWFMGSPSSYNQNLARWEPYMRFKPNIELKTVYYYDTAYDNPYAFRGYEGKTLKEIAQQYSKSMEVSLKGILTPDEIHKVIDLKPEMNRYVMQLKWKGRSTYLRVFDDQMMWPSETEVSAAFKRLLQAKLPKVAFVTGELERDIDKSGDRDYKAITNLSTFRNSLINQGFDVDTLSLDAREVPTDIATLVIADPKIALSPVAAARLQQYINNGGNLLIAGEPGKQAVINPLLQPLGVKLMDGTLIQESKELAPNLVAPDMTPVAATFTKALAKKVADSLKISMPGAAALSYSSNSPFTIQPLLMTDARLTWNRIKPLDLDMMTNASMGSSSGGMMMSSGGMAVAVSTVGGGSAMPSAAKVSTTPATPAANATDNAALAERKKKAEAMQASVKEIMSGPGTQEEKQQKVRELMMKAAKEAEASLSPEERKKREAMRTELAAIMNGPGTPEEKRKKAGELMAANAKKAQAPVQVMKAPEKTAAANNTPSAAPSAAPVSVVMGSSTMGGSHKKSAAAGTVTFSAADGDVRGSMPTVLSLTRKINGKEQRIIVAGDADFMSNSELQRYNLRTANFVFNTALFSWLSYGEFPIDTSRPDARDKRVNVTMDQVDFLRIVYVWILPAILLALGAILLIRRKRK